MFESAYIEETKRTVHKLGIKKMKEKEENRTDSEEEDIKETRFKGILI